MTRPLAHAEPLTVAVAIQAEPLPGDLAETRATHAMFADRLPGQGPSRVLMPG